MDDRQALIDAYQGLGRRVDQSLHIQNGDTVRLRVQLDEVHAFAADAERVRSQRLWREKTNIRTLFIGQKLVG